MVEGWLKLHRALAHHALWLGEKFSRGQAWVDLLMLANHRPGYVRVRGLRVEIQRGQVGHSEVTLAARWQWSRDKVRRFMHELQQDSMITAKRDSKISIITVTNYDQYQDSSDADNTANKTAKHTADRQQTRQQTDTNKNEKNDKKKDISFVEGSIELRLATFLFNCIRKNRPEFKQPDLQTWAKHVDLMLRIDKREPEHVREVIKWAQADNTPRDGTGFCWAVNILSTLKLRKQFDQLAIKMEAAQSGKLGAHGEDLPMDLDSIMERERMKVEGRAKAS